MNTFPLFFNVSKFKDVFLGMTMKESRIDILVNNDSLNFAKDDSLSETEFDFNLKNLLRE